MRALTLTAILMTLPAAGRADPGAAPSVQPAATAAAAPGALLGVLVDADGRGIEGERLDVVALDRDWSGEVVTDADGVFEVASLPPGRYAVLADPGTPMGRLLGAAVLRVADGALARVELTATAADRLAVAHAGAAR